MKTNKKENVMVDINEELFDELLSTSQKFHKEYIKIQIACVIEKIGEENKSILFNDEYFRKSLLVNAVATSVIFAFHLNCISEWLPHKKEPNKRELELINLWNYEICKWNGVDSEGVALLIQEVILDYQDAFEIIRNGGMDVRKYLNKGLMDVVAVEDFALISKDYIKVHGIYDFEEITDIIYNKMNCEQKFI